MDKKCICVLLLLFFFFFFGGGGLTKDRDFVGKMLLGASYSTSDKLLLVARHILTMGLQKCLYNWLYKIRKFTVTSFHCEERTHQK